MAQVRSRFGSLGLVFVAGLSLSPISWATLDLGVSFDRYRHGERNTPRNTVERGYEVERGRERKRPQFDDSNDPAAPFCSAAALKSEHTGLPANIESNNNSQVLDWKVGSENTFHARARVQGHVVRVYPDRNGHKHFSIQIGPKGEDTIEVVYNVAFGESSEPSIGTPVEACGDYITSTGPSPAPGGGSYPASPDGAIIHWVHRAPSRSGHHSGFLVIGGVLTGQGRPSHLH